MQRLLEFLIGKRHWLLFLLCEIVSFALLYQNNDYQRNVFLSSANVVSGSMLSASNSVVSFMNLRTENKILMNLNEQLKLEALNLKLQIDAMKADRLPNNTITADTLQNHYELISARVINNSVSNLLNYTTIDKGYRDGIRPEMGVISDQGVVGKVFNVNDRYSVVISLLNPKWKLSCKLLNQEFNGSLVWDGRDVQYAMFEELPTHIVFQEGDTVVTTGFSGVFPSDVIAGTVVGTNSISNTGSNTLKVKLATDFRKLSLVWVVKNNFQPEQWEIEQEASKNE
ncbi:MAG: rod shape-determining protein MreC [Tannerella sp.]|jgi:rod shape-determining protein MreC|nr:rod shape-determining protein MreC [Tannerella sp.]